MCINNNVSAKYLSTANTCIHFDISDDFLFVNKKNGTFQEGIHYAQPNSKMLRWNVAALEKWFGFTQQDTVDTPDFSYNNQNTKINIDRYLN